MADKNTIKNWFKTGLKPTQAQFWATWDSFWHKDEKIPITAIEDIETILNEKADAEALTNHVSDTAAHATLFGAKEDKNKKGVAGGYAPLDEFVKISSQYLSIVDDLVTGGSTSLLAAEQGKLLQTQINNINILLASDNVNLDNVQEIVDAIETVQASLSTILVNDLTTGGTTKALTAEMGKILKGLHDALVDVVAGKEPAITGGAVGQYYDYNKSWQNLPIADVSGKQDIANQVEVGSSQNAQASWHGKTVVFVTSCTITIPSSLVNSYIFNGVTLAGVNITWAIASPHTWLFGAPATTTEKQIFTLTKRGSTNDILLLGV
ncbi:hypothetical protein [Flavobacterium laiguense]|uniref:Phage tail protein n=1 Tax=Flavobacterium laiguense TaxID=2169409 RepID=A0A2U1JKD3_9FLAO|nr:hypothetical protein [Flavobacterium laiguense]PWA05475.1 hypothetical protein DB891_17040 [Flavobacterium laiguense]